MTIVYPISPLPQFLMKLSNAFKRDSTPQSSIIRDLENICVATHQDLTRLAEAFKALNNFKANFAEISGYYANIKEAGELKYELHKHKETSLLTNRALDEIENLKDYLIKSQSTLSDKTKWLWNLIKSQKFTPINKDGATKLADFEAFSSDEQKAIDKLAQESLRIFRVITARCVDNGKWISTDKIIENSQYDFHWGIVI